MAGRKSDSGPATIEDAFTQITDEVSTDADAADIDESEDGSSPEGAEDEDLFSDEAVDPVTPEDLTPEEAMIKEGLEEEIRGWSDIPQLPVDHGLTLNQLRSYLDDLESHAARGRHPATFPSWQEASDYPLTAEVTEIAPEA